MDDVKIGQLTRQAGTIQVNLAPLLLLIGVAMTASDGSVSSAVDAMFEVEKPDADS